MTQQEMEALFQGDPQSVQQAIDAMTQHEALVAADLLMARRGHNPRDRKWLVPLWRRDRVAWGVAQQAKRDKKEAEE